MIEIFYHTTDKDGFMVPGHYQSEDPSMVFSEHVEAARKQAAHTGSNFCIDRSVTKPTPRPSWIDPNWPVILVPKKPRKTYMGRYVD